MTGLAMIGSYRFKPPSFYARSTDGTLWLYVGDGHGGFFGRRAVGHGWQTFSALTGVGDWDQDGSPDVLGVRSMYDGQFLFYQGWDDHPLSVVQFIGSGWQGYRLAS
jgi:hypothetical protein